MKSTSLVIKTGEDTKSYAKIQIMIRVTNSKVLG